MLDWIKTLAKEDPESHLHVIAALERLQEVGPTLRRPTVGAIEKSTYRNMRELRPPSLIAGNKATRKQWTAWYSKAIKEADAKYASYLEALAIENKEHRKQ
ncbi:addiction module toxin RelE [Streptacidiphilus sp. EB103A]|uniref:addiction module toxin RelE n=1 Tax=Streptacidiphilus sp. EB103A TaxID=3156275 RepID=UPI003511D316